MPEPKFEWYKDKAGKFRFRLIAPNGEKIAISEAYSSKEAVIRSIESVKINAPVANIQKAITHEVWKKRPSRPFRRRKGSE